MNNILSKYDTLLFDIDDTILDFQKSERKAMRIALETVGLKVTDEILDHYHQVNVKYWQMVEKNIINNQEVLYLRHQEFLPLYGIDYDPKEFEKLYRSNLNKLAYVKKNARKVLKELVKTHRVYAITNGAIKTQKNRMKKSNMQQYFIKSYISYELGVGKPDIRFFNIVKNDIENFDERKTLIIGDSLTSDIKLGNNANVDTCWLNEHNKVNNSDIKPTYEIKSLLELL